MTLRRKKLMQKGTIRWAVLACLVGLELFLVSFLQADSAPASHAFLIKNGKQFVVFWSHEGRYESRSYGELRQALDFARTELQLEQAPSTGRYDLERLWMQDRYGSYVLLWKSLGFPHLNQLTFARESEARFFESAFRAGAYTPSPFGHSVLLLPTLTR